MSYFHTATNTVYDQLPDGIPASEFTDIGQRPSDWHYWDNASSSWVEDVAGKLAAQNMGVA